MNIKILSNNPYNTNYMAGTPISNVIVNITGQTTWTGITDINGKVKDINNHPPELPYGSYLITTTKYGYTDGSANFTVPDTSTLIITMTLIKVPIDITITD